MIYAVIDTNVFVSGLLNPDNPPGWILRMIYEGRISPVITEDILEEISRVVNYERFKFTQITRQGILSYLKTRVIKTSNSNMKAAGVPEDDIKFIIAALESGANLIITGNTRHFKAVAIK